MGFASKVAFKELARSVATSDNTGLVASLDAGLCIVGADVAGGVASLRTHAQKLGLRVTKVTTTVTVDGGAPSSLVNDALSFCVATRLHARGYAFLMGCWMRRFRRTDTARVGIALNLHTDDHGTVSVLLDRPMLLRGATRAAAMASLVPGAVRYALPSMMAVQVVSVAHSLDAATEPLGKPHALERYWAAMHGIALADHSDGDNTNERPLYARVRMQGSGKGGAQLTYPACMLLSSAIIADPITRHTATEAHQRELAELEHDLMADITAMPIFRKAAPAVEP